MISFLITTIIIQLIVFCVMFLYYYFEATSEFNIRYYGTKSKLEFLEFRKKHKWWHYTIPFYWVYTFVVRMISNIKKLEE